MAEAIYCRIKFAFLMALFFLPVLLTMWNRHLDNQIEQARYLPPLQMGHWADASEPSDEPDRSELADLSEAVGEITDP